jgi:hypothetical protein
MPDLVTQNPRQLGLGVEVGQDPSADVDVAAGIGEGVDDGVVHHPERPGQMWPLRARGESLSHLLHIILESRAVVEPECELDFLLGLLTYGYLLLLADERDLFFTGGGVGGTAHGQYCGRGPPHEQLEDRSCAPCRHHRLPVV